MSPSSSRASSSFRRVRRQRAGVIRRLGASDDRRGVRCAPSLTPEFFSKIPGLGEMLQHGQIVTATDYPGLERLASTPTWSARVKGTPCSIAYEPRRGLQACRQPGVLRFGDIHKVGMPLFAGQMAAFMPELKLVGIAAAAPATDLVTLLKDDLDSDVGRVLTSYVLWSWSHLYPMPRLTDWLGQRHGRSSNASLRIAWNPSERDCTFTAMRVPFAASLSSAPQPHTNRGTPC